MKYKAKQFPYGIYCLVLYKTIIGFPYWFKIVTCNSEDEFLDLIYKYMNKTPLTVPELMKEKERLEKELDDIKRLLREQIYKKAK